MFQKILGHPDEGPASKLKIKTLFQGLKVMVDALEEATGPRSVPATTPTRDVCSKARFRIRLELELVLRLPSSSSMASSFLDQYESIDVIGNGAFGIIRKSQEKVGRNGAYSSH